MKIAIKDITADPSIQIRHKSDGETIERYAEAFDRLPPIDVFETPEGLILADGFTRLAAAQRLKRREIEAKVRKGSRAAAEEFAVMANLTHGKPLTVAERRAAILRLHDLHPDWRRQQLAEAIGTNDSSVKEILDANVVKSRIRPIAKVPNSHLAEIARAPEQQWQPLADAAAKRDWSRAETGDAVRALKNGKLNDRQKRQLLAGEIDPPHYTEDGEPAIRRERIVRTIVNTRETDAILALERALEHLAKLRQFTAKAVVRDMDAKRLAALRRELPADIEFLADVLNAAMESGKKLEVVK